MINKIINCCNQYNNFIEHSDNPSQEEVMFIENYEIDFAKSIIEDLGSDNAEKIAKIILAVVE